MDQPTTIGLNLAKSVFQVHGVSADGMTVLRRQLRRGQVLAFFSHLEPCLIGMEACSGADHWVRELAALGHEVRLMPFIATIDPLDRSLHARILREAVCQARQDRPRGRRGNLRGCHPADHAVRPGEVGRRPGGVARPQGAGLPLVIEGITFTDGVAARDTETCAA